MNETPEIIFEITFEKRDGREHTFTRSALFKHDAIRAAMNAFQWRFGYMPVSAKRVQEVV